MARIVSLAEKLTMADAEREIETLEMLGHAAMLVEWRGRINFMNRLAEGLIGSDFGLCHGTLWTSDAASAARLHGFMAQIEASHAKPMLLPSPMVVSRAGLPWLMLEAMPVMGAARDTFGNGRAIILLSDLSRNGLADTAKLCLSVILLE